MAKNMHISNVIRAISASTCMSNMTFDIRGIFYCVHTSGRTGLHPTCSVLSVG